MQTDFSQHSDPLPFQHTRITGRPSLQELRRYFHARDAMPAEYLAGFRRPNEATADAVWRLVAPSIESHTLMDLHFTHKGLSIHERAAVELAAKQALTIGLGCYVRALRSGSTVSVNSLFSAVAGAFSDHYRRTRERSSADGVQDMLPDTARNAVRDLVVNGIKFEVLWHLLRGDWSALDGLNPLYAVRRVVKNNRARYTLEYRDNDDALLEFEAIVASDPWWRSAQSSRGVRFAHELRTEPRRPDRKVAGEIAYDVVASGKRAEAIMDAQEQAVVWLDAHAFREDYHQITRQVQHLRRELLTLGVVPDDHTNRQINGPDAIYWGQANAIERSVFAEVSLSPLALLRGIRRLSLPWIKKPADRKRAYKALRAKLGAAMDPPAFVGDVWRLLRRYETVLQRSRNLRRVYEQLSPLAPAEVAPGELLVPIRTNVRRIINRRYLAEDFSVMHAPSRVDKALRGRWFKAKHPLTDKTIELAHQDVSSSQTQIMAALLGLTDLESVARDKSFKHVLAKHALDGGYVNPHEYDGPMDERRLLSLVKALWMRVTYGSGVFTVVTEQAADPEEHGAGWAGVSNGDMAEAVRNAQAFLDKLPWYGTEPGDKGVREFLEVCQAIGDAADPHDGLVLRDPYDGAEIRWNSLRRHDERIKVNDLHLDLSVPDIHNGRPVVDHNELSRFVAPCLIHSLDAYYSALVMENLAGRGVRDVLNVNDCWYLPAEVLDRGRLRSGDDVLSDALVDVVPEWFSGLGPVFDFMERYLPAGHPSSKTVSEWRERWERRVAAGDNWPSFRT